MNDCVVYNSFYFADRKWEGGWGEYFDERKRESGMGGVNTILDWLGGLTKERFKKGVCHQN